MISSIRIVLFIFLVIVSHQQTKLQYISKQYKCDYTFYRQFPQVLGKLLYLTIPDIHPYIENKNVCLVMTQSNYINASNQQFISKALNIYPNQTNKQLFNESITQIQIDKHEQKLYFLRVDSLPNVCLSVKNDVKFHYIPQSKYNQFVLSKNSFENYQNIWIASFNIKKQCANINMKLNQPLKGHISLILEVKYVITQLFGFPIYQQPFKDLAILFILLIIGYFCFQYFMNKNKQKSD